MGFDVCSKLREVFDNMSKQYVRYFLRPKLETQDLEDTYKKEEGSYEGPIKNKAVGDIVRLEGTELTFKIEVVVWNTPEDTMYYVTDLEGIEWAFRNVTCWEATFSEKIKWKRRGI